MRTIHKIGIAAVAVSSVVSGCTPSDTSNIEIGVTPHVIDGHTIEFNVNDYRGKATLSPEKDLITLIVFDTPSNSVPSPFGLGSSCSRDVRYVQPGIREHILASEHPGIADQYSQSMNEIYDAIGINEDCSLH